MFDLFGHKYRFGECGGVEPCFAHHLLIDLAGAGVDTGQVDLDAGLGLLGFGRVEIQRGAGLGKVPVHGHAHLLEAEANFAFVGLYGV